MIAKVQLSDGRVVEVFGFAPIIRTSRDGDAWEAQVYQGPLCRGYGRSHVSEDTAIHMALRGGTNELNDLARSLVPGAEYQRDAGESCSRSGTMLGQIAAAMDRMARQSLVGGWSTECVETQQNLARDLFAHLGRGGSDVDPGLLRSAAQVLDRMVASKSGPGGWSTNGLETMQQMAGDIYAYLGRGGHL